MPTDFQSLPIYKHRDEINEAIEKHKVVVVEGPTGCGKTTQLPRILLRNPFITGKIALTQPRRIAAVSVAARIAKEVGCELGQEVGYTIRFDDKTTDDTLLKVMTDGILLQESRTDHLFSAYQVIIIDEAHERSLNIDLVLGLLKRALEYRDDLRVIVSSATIQTERFRKYFNEDLSKTPLISIQASVYPVEIGYRPAKTKSRDEVPEMVVDEVKRIVKSGEDGHILVFLSGVGAINDCERALEEAKIKNLWILPLYGQLVREEQEKVFEDCPGKRKVVLATNIAETSITIPDVRFVIDSGVAKIPRYSNKTNITSLLEEGVSLASLAQRAGRAGRTAPGKVIRLFDEKDLKFRPKFTEEEMTRLDLSEVLLRLIDIGVSDVERFPFPTLPPEKAIEEALTSLRKMEAIDKHNHLTEIGKKMVYFPLLPKLARCVVEAGISYPNVLREVIIVASFLSVKSPFIFPPGEESEARQAQKRFAHPMGDLLTSVKTFEEYEKSKDKARFCEKYYLDKEIMDFILKSVWQILEISHDLGMFEKEKANENDLIIIFLKVYCDQYLVRSGNIYKTIKGLPISIHPSGVLAREKHSHILSVEFIRSFKTYAQQCSVLRPVWVEKYARSEKSHVRHVSNYVRRENLRLESRKADVSRDDAPSSESLQIGKWRFMCLSTRKETHVIIPSEAIEDLKVFPAETLSDTEKRYKATIRNSSGNILSGYTLEQTILLASVIEISEAREIEGLPFGPIFDIRANAALLIKYLDRLGTLIVTKRKKSAYLSVDATVDGQFWFDTEQDIFMAYSVTVQALKNMLGMADADASPKIRARLGKMSKESDHLSWIKKLGKKRS